MKRMMAALMTGLMLIPGVVRAAPADEVRPHYPAQCCFREMENCGQYGCIGTVTVSAYHPYEDSYQSNWKGRALSGLVGEIVAAPTGSELLGKTVAIVSGEEVLIRRVDDTGCKPGRIDLLVAGDAEMGRWGLRECVVYVVEG